MEIKCPKLKMKLPNPLRMNLQMSQSEYSGGSGVPKCRAELVLGTSRKINLVLWMK